MRWPILFPLMLMLAAGLSAAPASAQTIDITPSLVQFSTPSVADFTTGYIDHAGGMLISVTGRGNSPWIVQISAANPTLGGGKPVAHVLWRLEGSTTWTPLTTAPTQIWTDRGTLSTRVYFRLMLFWTTDLPATYQVPVVLTIT
jgi:hypothetical protein